MAAIESSPRYQALERERVDLGGRPISRADVLSLVRKLRAYDQLGIAAVEADLNDFNRRDEILLLLIPHWIAGDSDWEASIQRMSADERAELVRVLDGRTLAEALGLDAPTEREPGQELPTE